MGGKGEKEIDVWDETRKSEGFRGRDRTEGKGSKPRNCSQSECGRLFDRSGQSATHQFLSRRVVRFRAGIGMRERGPLNSFVNQMAAFVQIGCHAHECCNHLLAVDKHHAHPAIFQTLQRLELM